MRTRYLWATLAIALGAAACGSNDNGPSFASTIDSVSARDAATDAANFANDVGTAIVNGNTYADIGSLLPAKGLTSTNYVQRLLANIEATALRRAHRPVPQGALSAAPDLTSPFSECHPTITGVDADTVPIDTDNNGVPDDLKITFPANCIASDSAGTNTTQWTGSVELKDLGGLYAYRLNAGNLKVKSVETATGNYFQIAVNGFETATYAASSITHQTGISYGISYSGLAPSAPAPGTPMATPPSTGSLTFDYNETSAYDPDGTVSMANPIPSGDLTFNFDYKILASSTGQPDQNFHFTMNTSTALHYDTSTCSDVVSGVIHGLLNGNNAVGFTVTWTGCDSWTVETFGTTEPTT